MKYAIHICFVNYIFRCTKANCQFGFYVFLFLTVCMNTGMWRFINFFLIFKQSTINIYQWTYDGRNICFFNFLSTSATDITHAHAALISMYVYTSIHTSMQSHKWITYICICMYLYVCAWLCDYIYHLFILKVVLHTLSGL